MQPIRDLMVFRERRRQSGEVMMSWTNDEGVLMGDN
jgi:hypothetical protein